MAIQSSGTPDDPLVPVFLRVPRSLKQQVVERAAKKDVSVSVWASRVFTYALHQHDTPQTAPGRRTAPRR